MAPPVSSWPAGAGDRARLDRFRLRRGLKAADLPAYAAARLAAARAAPAEGPGWRPLGPFAVPHGLTLGSGPGSRPRVAGRVAALAVDPRDPAHLLAGTAAGGVWESRDGGRHWRPRTDGQPSPAVGAVAFAPGDPAVAYAGTGQGEPLAALGVGLLRSHDGGASWRLLAAEELLGVGFHGLLVHHGDAGRLLAATTGGLLGSDDGGGSWRRRLAGRSWAVSPGAGGELLAGGEHGLHRSEDGGGSWRQEALPAAPAAFDRVAVGHAAGGQVAYVFAAGDGVGHLWRRDRAGGPFEPVRPPADLHSQQAWHDWALAVDPGDPDVVWLGAAGLHRGVRGADGRFAWVDLAARPAGDSLPQGQQAVVLDPADPRVVYVAGAGGLFRSPDGGRSWRSLGTGLAVAGIELLAGHPDHDAWLLAGAGELGTLRYEGTEVWFRAGGLPAPAERAGVAPVAVGEELVCAGERGLAVAAGGGSAWTEVGLPQARGAVTALAAAGPGRLLAGTAEGELLALERAGGWAVRGVARPRAGRVAAVAVEQRRPEVAWAAWSAWSGPEGGRVWRSGDAGATWEDRGAGLPPLPVSGFAPDPERPGTVFAATDAGVWRSRDDGASWHRFGRGLPDGPALALAPWRRGRRLRVGLLGRGAWELPLDEGPAAAAAAPCLRPNRPGVPGGWWWESPDIKVEPAPAPAAGPPDSGPPGPVELEDDRGPEATGLPEHGGRVRPGRPARVHVQVHHRGDSPLREVRVRVLAVPACLRPPELPGGGWLAGGDPPPGSPWRAVGPAAAVGDLEPGRSAVASFAWDVPADLPRGVCLLAVAAAGEDPPAATATAADPAELAAGGGSWALKSLTALEPADGQVVRLDLWGPAGGGPCTLAAQGWVSGLVAGLVLGPRLGAAARVAGLVPARAGEPWRPELVALVQEDLGLAERLDLAAAYPLPAARRPAGPPDGPAGGAEVWLEGVELAPDRPEPLLLLLGDPPTAGGGALLLLDAGGRVLGGHTLRVPG
jgi:hypothetical protein